MNELWREIGGFFEILFTRNVLIEIAAVGMCLAAGWFAGAALRARAGRAGRVAPTSARGRLSPEGLVVIAPELLALAFVLLARALLQAAGTDAAPFDTTLIDVAVRLIGAYAVVRVGVFLFATSLGNKSWIVN